MSPFYRRATNYLRGKMAGNYVTPSRLQDCVVGTG